jgi:hypothetical protein
MRLIILKKEELEIESDPEIFGSIKGSEGIKMGNPKINESDPVTYVDLSTLSDRIPPQDRQLLSDMVERFAKTNIILSQPEIKSVLDKVKEIEKDRKLISTEIYNVLHPYQSTLQDFPTHLNISNIPIYYNPGRVEINENKLLELGVKKEIIDKAKIRGKGWYVIDRQGRKE